MTDTATVTPLRPQVTEAEAASLKLDSYVMHIKEQQCLNCSCGEQWSELYEVWTHPTKTRASALNVLRPTLTLQRLDIAYIRIPTVMVPICSECVANLSMDTLPQPIPAASRAAWAETLRRKHTPEPAAAPPPRAPTRSYTPTPKSPPRQPAKISTRRNLYPGPCWCCGTQVGVDKGFVFDLATWWNRTGWKLACTVCNDRGHVPQVAARRQTRPIDSPLADVSLSDL